jgi:predicted transcriptional regulator
MLVRPASHAAAPATVVGSSCRICPRPDCPARREPTILTEAG